MATAVDCFTFRLVMPATPLNTTASPDWSHSIEAEAVSPYHRWSIPAPSTPYRISELVAACVTFRRVPSHATAISDPVPKTVLALSAKISESADWSHVMNVLAVSPYHIWSMPAPSTPYRISELVAACVKLNRVPSHERAISDPVPRAIVAASGATAPPVRVVTPVMPTVLPNVDAPVTPSVPPTVVLLVTASVLENVTAPVTASVPENDPFVKLVVLLVICWTGRLLLSEFAPYTVATRVPVATAVGLNLTWFHPSHSPR